ncbi:SDR family NAD(P)-dependent oxidoreductase [Tessaracoccus antarcticus]|uniref:SDR family NAD(P)-dependent oxidoreductase n=1 Tax=Tessaracoccus antarcticus TaxID=2479848 RepID=A0A3M0GRH4_9ACTN|nr:SDR family NAD(P)-dependent oxidoreductase [Tessaracoccus antarcticus]RMB59876.1 SDR family NAD(P)-dependent oxidoreductase [Tessaracoccus antarcticus]
MIRTSHRDVLAGATVVITGAARGMGAIYARRAVREGASAVALWDVDEALAAELAEELGTSRCRVVACGVDLDSAAQIAAMAQRTRDELGCPSIVINNAGIVRAGQFADQDPSRDIEQTMSINALAPMLVTREFLPGMIADRSRHHRILNIASAAGTLANPNMSVYAASKWAVIGWSESLRLELVRSGNDHVAVTTFCPSFVSTGMFAGARGPLLTPIMTPDSASDAAWRGMVAGRPMVLKPWTVKLGMAFRGVLPTPAWDIVADKVFHVYSSMDHFTGRT